MSQGSPEIEFFFAPFDSLTFRKDTPIVAFGFENQDDTGITKHFPEIESSP